MSNSDLYDNFAWELYATYIESISSEDNPLLRWEDLPETEQVRWQAVADSFEDFDIELDDREQALVNHARHYAENFSQAGVPGHAQFILIAKLANALNL
jgi:hypothetical protein